MNENTFILIMFIVFILIMTYFVIDCIYTSRKRKREYEENQRKWEERRNDTNWWKKTEEELDRNFESWKKEHSDEILVDSSSSYHYNYTSNNDSYYDVTSPHCPYGIYYNF